MKKNRAPFKVGDLVVSSYCNDERHIVRRIIDIKRESCCSTGWLASADGGKPCSVCHHVGNKILDCDSSYFKAAPKGGSK